MGQWTRQELVPMGRSVMSDPEESMHEVELESAKYDPTSLPQAETIHLNMVLVTTEDVIGL